MVQLKYLLNFVFLALWIVVYGRIEIFFDGSIDNCGKDRNFDLSELELIPFNDTHVVLNGKYYHFCY